MDLFKGRPLIIATKHHKERVIAPILEKAIGVKCFVDDSFDTDTLGTFSGETKRQQDPLSTARLKCLKAMELNNCDLGVASEGSFGPHPAMVFASADDEFLIFIDKKHNLEIVARELSLETNFNGKLINNEKELLEFATRVQFPSHGVILKSEKNDFQAIVKGITEENLLLSTFNSILTEHGQVYAETDMRAMLNPSRMAVIKKAAEALANKIKSQCPNCGAPGFGATDTKTGLPCELCGLPTRSIKSLVFKCQKCNYTEERPPKHGKTKEDAMYCDFCNP